MLAHAPRQHHAGSVHPGGLSGWLRRRHIARFELGCVGAFHLLACLFLVLVPRDQIVTPGTSAIFGTIPLPVWAVAFLLTGGVAALATRRPTFMRLSLTWCGVFPLGAAWIFGLSVAVTDGRGNALLALVWPFLLIWWATTAARMYFGGSETRWGGG